jgi:hypothetical protein
MPLLQESKVSHFAHRLTSRADRLYEPDMEIALSAKSSGVLGLPRQNVRLGHALDRLNNQIYVLGFDNESQRASVLSDFSRAIQRSPQYKWVKTPYVTREVALHKFNPPPRHLQARVYAELEDKRVLMKESFAAGLQNTAEIHIGPRLEYEDLPILLDPFPEKLLPPTQDGSHLLTVIFMEPNSMEQPLVSSLLLPLVGPSIPCMFSFTPKENATNVEARVTVLHQNRVLQSAVLRGPVAQFSKDDLEALSLRQDSLIYSPESHEEEIQPDEKIEKRSEISFVISGAVHQAISRFSERPRFDTALVLNDLGGKPGITGAKGNIAAYLSLDDSVKAAKTNIEKILDVQWGEKDYRGLYSKGTTKLLNDLAYQGAMLYQAIVDFLKFKELGLADATKIQVIIAKQGSRIPLEFIYDYPAPREDATVCPHAEEALETGQCSPHCEAMKNPSPYICPLGFWCLNRVLEWHVFDGELKEHTNGNDYKLEIDERRRIPPIELPGKPVLGYSNKVTEVKDKASGFTLSRFRKNHPTTSMVRSWSKWKSKIQRQAPSILILLSHTILKPYDKYVLEIGPLKRLKNEYESRLPLGNLGSEHILGPNREAPPIVLLLGCKTDAASTSLQSAVASFQHKKAAIVLSTPSDTYAPLAGRIADLLLDWLLKAVDGTKTFGDVMLQVRRQALKEGIPMVLSIYAYGDADWKLAKEVAQEAGNVHN